MLTTKAPWSLKDVLSVHVLRFIAGFILVRLLYPILFSPSAFIIEITDRVVVISLVALFVQQKGYRLSEFGLSLNRLSVNLLWGFSGGAGLLLISLFSERFLITYLLLTPTDHPLVSAVGQAKSWQGLIVPLFLAGIAAPVAEELLYRLFTFLPLKDRYGLAGGALISAGIFALFHFNPFWLPEMLMVGAGLSILYYRTGSLTSAIVAHSFINSSKLLMLFFGITII